MDRLDNKVVFTYEEITSIKLADSNKYNEEKASKTMNLSKKEYRELLKNSRQKLLNAVMENKEIVIEDKREEEIKEIITTLCKFRCAYCGKIYEINYLKDAIRCPSCNSTDIMKLEDCGIY